MFKIMLFYFYFSSKNTNMTKLMNRLESLDTTSAKTVTTIPFQELTMLASLLALSRNIKKNLKKNWGKNSEHVLCVLKASFFMNTQRGVIIAVILHLT